jgi:hypothetical protein
MLSKPFYSLCFAALSLTLSRPNVVIAAEQPSKKIGATVPSPAEKVDRAIKLYCADRFDRVGSILDAEVAYMRAHGDFSGEVIQYIANHYVAMASSPVFRDRDVPSLSNVNPSPAQQQARSEVVRALVIQFARERAGLEPGQCDDLVGK